MTTGTDWPAIVAAISTGVVGLAGIGGTLWQGKRAREAQTADLKGSLDATAKNLRLGINAEDNRARIAEKRRIYAAYQAALSELAAAVFHNVSLDISASHDERTEAQVKILKAREKVFATVSEVHLIAPKNVAKLAANAGGSMMKLMRLIEKSESGDYESDLGEGNTIRESLYAAMRADLGETD
jgi:hypothetical protein